MADKHEKTAAEQLQQIRQQRRVLAQQQVEEAAARMAAGEELSDVAAGLLTGNLALIEMTEATFSRMVDHLRQVPILAGRVEAVDQLALGKRITELETELATLLTRNRQAEIKIGNELDRLRQQALSVSTAADRLAGISQRYPGMVGLPSVHV